ncbi:MAG: AarF/ABC1/UbiB kinase family protein [Chloroflexi bacterium]|nr:AarF/ABC1/UbiB kinase family protein [Chloroflexota bacterium]
MKLSKRISRTYAVVSLAARVYLGYKWITVREKRFGLRHKKAQRQRLRHHTWSANHFYDTAVRRQGLLIKLGQIIGSRPDLIPDEYIDVLSRLHDTVPPRSFNVIRRVIERELERPLADLFDDFEEAPIAAASLAQVHRARLKPSASAPAGRVVAVKVQYPGIEEIVDNDLQNVRLLLRILARFEGNLDFTPIIEELSHNAPQELDFINEGHNAEAIAKNFAGRENVVVPEIIWEYSTRRVLTMEFMEGIKITDVESLRRDGIEPQAVAQLVTDVYCEQLYLHGMFHADPHPGNLLVQPGPTLVMLDFGLCRQYDDTFRLRYAKMTNAMLRWDLPALVEAYKELGIKVKNPDDPAVYIELGRAFMETSRPGEAYADPDLVAESNQRFEKAVRANPVTDIPRELLLIMRVTGLLSGLGKHLESSVDVTQTLLPYTEAALAEAK